MKHDVAVRRERSSEPVAEDDGITKAEVLVSLGTVVAVVGLVLLVVLLLT